MRFLLTLLMLAALLWSGALAWFVNTLPEQNIDAAAKTQALVVLTGGQGRVEHGLEMLAQGAAPVLFISGVGAHATQEQILSEHATATIREGIYANNAEIVLDHVARSTVSNADQAAVFLKKRNITRIRLITASYHMRRSLREFRTACPGVAITPDPVFPEGFRREEWWKHENTRRLVFSEFYKYFAVLLRDWVRPAQSSEASKE